MRKNWNKEEISFLKQNYKNLTPNQLAKELDRKVNSVHLKLRSLGLVDFKRGFRRPIVGEKYTRLSVLEILFKNSKHDNKPRCFAKCVCECGTVKIVAAALLLNGMTKSCGCYHKDFLVIYNTIHGGTGTDLFTKWASMNSRCSVKTNTGYIWYGARGIKVCDEWQTSFEIFRDWAMLNGYKHGLTLERIDVNGNYCPENCKFITMKEQNYNRRATRRLTAFGETKILSEWAKDERCLVSYSGLKHRVNIGMSPEEALSTPSQKKNSSLK